MDEEDGRPGAAARQSGPLDAPGGILAFSLLLSSRQYSVPHPCRFFLSQGWNTSYPSLSGVPSGAKAIIPTQEDLMLPV